MSIKAGDRLPEGKFKVMTENGPKDLSTGELFNGKRVVLFAVPGAFTPTCDAKHLPGYLGLSDQIRAKGVDTIACMAVKDVFVMNAWGKASGSAGKVLMLADGNGDYARALGLTLDASGFGGGLVLIVFALAASHRPNTPPTVSLILPGFWLLVPGSLGFMGVTELIGTHSSAGATTITTPERPDQAARSAGKNAARAKLARWMRRNAPLGLPGTKCGQRTTSTPPSRAVRQPAGKPG